MKMRAHGLPYELSDHSVLSRHDAVPSYRQHVEDLTTLGRRRNGISVLRPSLQHFLSSVDGCLLFAGERN